jgi:hypothetical protein
LLQHRGPEVFKVSTELSHMFLPADLAVSRHQRVELEALDLLQ